MSQKPETRGRRCGVLQWLQFGSQFHDPDYDVGPGAIFHDFGNVNIGQLARGCRRCRDLICRAEACCILGLGLSFLVLCQAFLIHVVAVRFVKGMLKVKLVCGVKMSRIRS